MSSIVYKHQRPQPFSEFVRVFTYTFDLLRLCVDTQQTTTVRFNASWIEEWCEYVYSRMTPTMSETCAKCAHIWFACHGIIGFDCF